MALRARSGMSTNGGSQGQIEAPPRRRAAGSRRWIQFALAPLGICLVLWVFLLSVSGNFENGPRPRALGADFALNITGSVILQHGGNPYDHNQTIATQQSFFARQGIKTVNDKMTRALTWGGYPPLYFWLLQPLTHIPFRAIGLIWIISLYGFMGLGFLCILHYLGWKRRLIPTLIFMAMPQTTIEAFYGNPAALVFALIAGSLFVQRRHPVWGGCLISLAWLKPQLAVPAMILIVLFHVNDRRRFLKGIVIGSFALLAATLASVGIEPMVRWVGEMGSVSSMAGEQPKLIPLVGLYAGVVSATLRQMLQMGLLTIAAGLTAWWWFKLRPKAAVPPLQVAWLWVVWLLALPYAHFPDEILLSLPVLALIGRDGSRLYRPCTLFALYGMFATVLLYSYEPHQVQTLSLPLIALGVILYRARDAHEEAVPELAILSPRTGLPATLSPGR